LLVVVARCWATLLNCEVALECGHDSAGSLVAAQALTRTAAGFALG